MRLGAGRCDAGLRRWRRDLASRCGVSVVDIAYVDEQSDVISPVAYEKPDTSNLKTDRLTDGRTDGKTRNAALGTAA